MSLRSWGFESPFRHQPAYLVSTRVFCAVQYRCAVRAFNIKDGANNGAFVIMRACICHNARHTDRLSYSSSQCRSYLVEIAQYALLVAGWTVAFLLGRELQNGFKIWRDSRNREVVRQPSED